MKKKKALKPLYKFKELFGQGPSKLATDAINWSRDDPMTTTSNKTAGKKRRKKKKLKNATSNNKSHSTQIPPPAYCSNK